MRKLLHKVFNRIVIVAILVAMQAGLLILELHRFSNSAVYVSTAMKILSVVVVFFIIYKRNSNHAIKLSFVVPILLFPIFGGILYIFFGHLFLPPRMKKNIKITDSKIASSMNTSSDVLAEIKAIDSDVYAQFNYISRYAPAIACKNSNVQYFDDGEPYWKSLQKDLIEAKEYIFMEYFIIGLGEMWSPVLEILKQKVEEGVEVRLIYDDFGSAYGLPNKYDEQLNAVGIKCIAFNRIIPFFATVLNNRDHRKIVVIDGKVGYTGGINLADEYINRRKRFGYWKDAGLRIEGDAVWNMTVLFLQMWNYTKNTDADFGVYRRHIMPLKDKECGYVQPYGDSPLDSELVGESVYVNMINNSREYLWIYTPYLIIDEVLMSSLILACKRGVDVRVVTPGVPDKKMVYYMTRCSYLPLLEAGAKIYEYTPGFIHAKCTICDDELVNIGTVNYDYRSLYHHFECGVLMYKTSITDIVKEDMQKTFEVCNEITEEYIRSRKFNINVMGPLLHLFAPLL